MRSAKADPPPAPPGRLRCATTPQPPARHPCPLPSRRPHTLRRFPTLNPVRSCLPSGIRSSQRLRSISPLSRHPALPIVATEPPSQRATRRSLRGPASSRPGSRRMHRSGHSPTQRHPQTLPPRLRYGFVPRASCGTAPTAEPTIGASTPSTRLRRPSAWQAICKAHLCHAPRRLRLIALQALRFLRWRAPSLPPHLRPLRSTPPPLRRGVTDCSIRLQSHPLQPPSHPHVTPVVPSCDPQGFRRRPMHQPRPTLANTTCYVTSTPMPLVA